MRLGKASVEVLPGKRGQGVEDGVPHDLGRAAGHRKVLEEVGACSANNW